ncbi:hypothetical protein OJF2_38490 [Aquisphaera giovannonii]|uniref:Uncharacterized protein n=1 Tax=Aquisphaera giovannonii TaxID=406548 RepID=A0A5B9W5P9_9BACT|nr:hypothetical protein [Aquisphaera giovannonii]QEH35301.1 hypothetical protein OJF2_38490 [Aquisphaera giovannonii]
MSAIQPMSGFHAWLSVSWHPLLAALAVLAACGVVLLGRALGASATADRPAGWLLAPGLGGAAWLLLVHLIGRWSGSFGAGLRWGTILAAAAGPAAWAFGRWRSPGRGLDDASPGRWPIAMIATALATTVLIAPMTLNWAFHDEQLYTGHTGIVAQIRNGHYPPRHMTFPELEYRYHYGFDTTAAAVATVFGVEPGVAMDLVTLASWPYVWCLLWAIGDRVVGPGRGWIASLLTMFGGGMPYLLALQDGYYVPRFVMIAEVGGMDLNPPMISYFFQHAWVLGLPLGLCLMLLVLDRDRTGAARSAGMALLLGALPIAQVVVFASMAGTVCVAEPCAGGRPDWRRVPGVAAALAFAMVVGWAGGGFFLPPPDRMGAGLSLQAGVVGTLAQTAWWHLLSFGLLLPLGIVGLFYLRGGRLLLGLLMAGGLGVMNFITYAHSWDIVKFGTVGALALSIAGAAAVARVLAIRPAGLGAALGGLLLAVATADGLAFPILFAADAEGIPLAMYPKRPSAPPAGADAEAIEWLRARVSPRDLVYRHPNAAIAYDHAGGLAVPWFDGLTDTFGFSPARMERRRKLLTEPSPDAGRYEAEGIRWFVLGPSGEGPLGEYADEWTRSGRARVEARFGRLRILRLVPPGDGAAWRDEDGTIGGGGRLADFAMRWRRNSSPSPARREKDGVRAGRAFACAPSVMATAGGPELPVSHERRRRSRTLTPPLSRRAGEGEEDGAAARRGSPDDLLCRLLPVHRPTSSLFRGRVRETAAVAAAPQRSTDRRLRRSPHPRQPSRGVSSCPC